MKNTIKFNQIQPPNGTASAYALLHNDAETEQTFKIPLTGEETILTTCPKCNKDFTISFYDFIEILSEGDLYGTQTYCQHCSEETQRESR